MCEDVRGPSGPCALRHPLQRTPSVPPVPSQSGILLEGTSCFGDCGLMVPAKTVSPSSNFSRAKFFASASVANVLVARGPRRLLDNKPRFCSSNVTYHVCRLSFTMRWLFSSADPLDTSHDRTQQQNAERHEHPRRPGAQTPKRATAQSVAAKTPVRMTSAANTRSSIELFWTLVWALHPAHRNTVPTSFNGRTHGRQICHSRGGNKWQLCCEFRGESPEA